MALTQNIPKEGNVSPDHAADTDHKNRTAADQRFISSEHHGILTAAGSVFCLFPQKGMTPVPRPRSDQDPSSEAILPRLSA